MSAAIDVTKADNYGQTPVLWACYGGYLRCASGCSRWLQPQIYLFEVGAANDVTTHNFWGSSPMYEACSNGHLDVCMWPFEAGAAADIKSANDDGSP